MSGSNRARFIRQPAVLCLLVVFVAISGCNFGNRKEGASSEQEAIERTAEKGPVKLFVRVRPREPRLSDLLKMEVRVEFQTGVEIKPPAFGRAVGDFLIRDYTERPPENGMTGQRRFEYELEPTQAGKHLIRSVAIEFVDKRPDSERKGQPALIETEPLEINVTSESADEVPSLANLEPIVQPRAIPQTNRVVWFVAAAALLAVLVVMGFVVFRRRKLRTVEPNRLTPEEIAHAALARLLAENLPAGGQIKKFYLRLTGIVRQYVEDTTGIRAPEETTEEFLRDIRSREVFTPERSTRLADFLESADLVKYAGQMPKQAQIEQAIERAREFVNMTVAPATIAVGN